MNLEQLVEAKALTDFHANHFAEKLGVSRGDELSDTQVTELYVDSVDQAYREGERAGSRDELTGLLGRAAFSLEVSSARARHNRYQTPFAIGVFDLDHLKIVNDTHGHKTGDKYIMASVRGLKKVIKRSTDGLFKIGSGDEFAAVLNDISVPGIEEVSTGVAAATAEEISRLGIAGHSLGVSAGYAHSDHAETIGDMEEIADMRMYEAKRGSESGQNRDVSSRPKEVRIPLFGWHKVAGSLTLGYTLRDE